VQQVKRQLKPDEMKQQLIRNINKKTIWQWRPALILHSAVTNFTGWM